MCVGVFKIVLLRVVIPGIIALKVFYWNRMLIQFLM